MRQQPSYQVFLNEGTISNRFYLHVTQGIQVNAFDEGCSGHEGRIALNNATGMNWDVRVYNTSDSLVGEQNNFTGTWEITSLTADEYRIHFMMSGQSLEVDEYVTIENGNGIVAQLTASATEIKMEEEELLLNCINQDAENIFWDLGDGTMVSGESEIAHIYPNSGNYQVMLTVRKGTCSDTATAEIMVINITGIEDAIASEQTIVKLYPNPASSIAFIQAKIEEPVKAAEVLVIDMAGRIVYQSEPKTLYPGNLLEIPVIGLPNGTYETILLLDGKRKGLRLSVNHK
jgi:PKD repeat protein